MNRTPLQYQEINESGIGSACALVLDAADLHGVALIRALGSMHIPVYAMGEPRSLGFYSRYITKTFHCQRPHDPDILLSALLETGEKLQALGKRAVLFPSGDKQVKVLAQNHELLSKYFITHYPSPDVFEQCLDKSAQCRMAMQIGVPFPRTYFSEEIDRLQTELGDGRLQFPILFKARQELPWQLRKIFRVIIIQNQQQLDDTLHKAAQENIPFLIQEIIPGGDDTLYTLGSCMTKDGELKAVFTGRKLRQRPPRFGECRVGESMHVEQIITDGAKLLRAMKFYGISQVEFKYDARDGKYKLIEINPRAWSWIGLPIAMGINIPYAYFCDAVGVPVPTYHMGNRHALWISLYHDLFWSLRDHDGKPWQHLFQSYDQRVESFMTFSDLKPSLVYLKRMLFDFAGIVWRRLLKRS